MKVFRSINLSGEKANLTLMIDDIRRSLADGWTRAVADEERINSRRGDRNPFYCFSCPRKGVRPAATIFLAYKDDNSMIYVPNVLPKAYGHLTFDEYNLILQDFFEQFVSPAAERNHVEAEITAGEKHIEDWVSPRSASLLRYFSDNANKQTGSANPFDRENWYSFLVSVHAEGNDLPSSTLARWLQEVGGWDAEQADNLAIEYEFAHGLLQFADTEKVEI